MTAEREGEPVTRAEAGRAGPGPPFGCWGSGIGGRDVGLVRGEEAAPAGRGGEGG